MDRTKLGLGKLLAALAIVVAVGALADDAAPAAPAAGTVTAPVAAPASQGKVVGILTLAPSVSVGNGELHTENALEAGYKFNKTLQISYTQFFNTNLFTPNDDAVKGVSLSNQGGFIRTRLNKLIVNGDFSFGMQNRTYLPVRTADRDKGMVAVVRQYLNFSQKVSNVVTLTAMEIPILHLYSKAGINGKANPAIENRLYLVGDFQITDKLSLSVPVMFHVQKARFLEGAANSSKTTYFAWINPELDYELNGNVTLGIGYYTDNLVKADLSGLDLNAGLKGGVLQALAYLSL